MPLKDNLENNCKLFVARSNPSKVGRTPKDFSTRLQEWEALFTELHMPCFFSSDSHEKDNQKNKQLCITFPNGLRVEDRDTAGVSFWADNGKDALKENMDSVVQTIRIVAKHLQRRGDNMVEQIFGKHFVLSGDNSPGSKPYVDAFVNVFTEKEHVVRVQPFRQQHSH